VCVRKKSLLIESQRQFHYRINILLVLGKQTNKRVQLTGKLESDLFSDELSVRYTLYVQCLSAIIFLMFLRSIFIKPTNKTVKLTANIALLVHINTLASKRRHLIHLVSLVWGRTCVSRG